MTGTLQTDRKKEDASGFENESIAGREDNSPRGSHERNSEANKQMASPVATVFQTPTHISEIAKKKLIY